MKQINTTVFATAAGDSGATSDKVDVFNIRHVSFQGITTGTLNGSFQAQASNDVPSAGTLSANFTPTNWSNIGSSVAAASSGVYLVPTLDCAYRWVRCVYTASSGSGNVTMTVCGLEF